MKVFSVQLKKARKAAGLTQKETADALGIKLETYQHYEAVASGHRIPDLEMLGKIADVLETTADFLIGR